VLIFLVPKYFIYALQEEHVPKGPMVGPWGYIGVHWECHMLRSCCPSSKSPGANIKEFLGTILGEAKEEQFPLFEPGGRVWKLPGANLRMIKKSFQRAKGDLSNNPLRPSPTCKSNQE
jgi:hypothetical protein